MVLVLALIVVIAVAGLGAALYLQLPTTTTSSAPPPPTLQSSSSASFSGSTSSTSVRNISSSVLTTETSSSNSTASYTNASTSKSTSTFTSSCAISTSMMSGSGDSSPPKNTVASLPIQVGIGAPTNPFVYDSQDKLIEVIGGEYGNTLFQINAVTNQVLCSIQLSGLYANGTPYRDATGITYDSANDQSYVAMHDWILAFNAKTLQLVSNMTGISYDSGPIVADPYNNIVYVPSCNEANRSTPMLIEISGNNDAVLTNHEIILSAPSNNNYGCSSGQTLFDTYNKLLYTFAANGTASSDYLFMINTSSSSVVGHLSFSQPGNRFMDYNPNNGDLYLARGAYQEGAGCCHAFIIPNDNITIFNALQTISSFKANPGNPNSTIQYIAYDSQSAKLFVTNGTVQQFSQPASGLFNGANYTSVSAFNSSSSNALSSTMTFPSNVGDIFINPVRDYLYVAEGTHIYVIDL
ncbi:MAG: hypothetical protein ACREBS_02285 [Nitrososphaerales archaeon]